MTQQTVLNALHRSLGARMVDFGGWDMPLHYGSQLEEHHQVRRHVGLFDVSHMTVVDLAGSACRACLARLLANDVAKLKLPGKALYTCMLNAQGGVIDDLIVYFLAEDRFRLVVNAATRDKDLAWIRQHAEGFAVSVTERRDLAMIAVQGPEARALVHAGLSTQGASAAAALSRFAAVEVDERFIARTGYTGEDGYEVILPADAAETQWRAWMEAGAKPAGLGARDTLRLEAGMNLYGQDMDESTTPFEAGLAWTVVLTPERDFVGADALRAQQAAGVARQLVGLVLDDKGVLRHGQTVHAEGLGDGEILSGTFSPTVGKGIALARIPAGTPGAVTVTIRDRQVPVRLVKPPFVKGGQSAV